MEPTASPTGNPLIPPKAVPYLTGVMLLALALSGAKSQFPELMAAVPGWVFMLANGVSSIGVLLGLISPGLRAKPETVLSGVAYQPPTQPVVELTKYIGPKP